MEEATNPQGVENTQETQSVNTSDLLKRANESASQGEEQTQSNTSNSSELPSQLFDRNDLSAIKDPFTRKQVEEVLSKKEKDMLRGMNEKFQEAARIRKEAESKAFDKLSTKEKLKVIQSDQSFLEYLQSQAQGSQNTPDSWDGTDEEWSALSSSEKAQFKALEGKVDQLMSAQQRAEIERQDAQIAEKLQGYDPKAVDKFQSEILQNKYGQAEIREMIGKALLFDQTIERVYNLGLQDRKLDISNRLNANNTLNGAQTQTEEPLPERGNMSSKDYFIQLAQRKLSQFGSK